jgi:Flp pilus assembly protein CpaB
MQRGRVLILVGILLVVVAAALVLMSSLGGGEEETREPGATPGGTELVPTAIPPTPTPIPNPVMVAKQRIPRGTLLITTTQIGLGDWISLESWPEGWLADDALTTFEQVQDKISRLDIPRGTILTADMLTDQPGDLSKVGSDAALLIPPDRVAIAIPVDHVSSLGWALRRGDHVDVLVSFLMVELDEEFQTQTPNYASGLVPIHQVEAEQATGVLIQGVYGRIEQDPFGQPINIIPQLGEEQRPRLVSQITVRDAEVLNVGPWLPWSELFHAAQSIGLTTDSVPAEEGEQVPDGEEGGEADSVPEAQIITSEAEELFKVLEEFSRQPVEPLLLIVSPQDALVLKWSIEQELPIHLVLRSYADGGVRLPDTEAVTLQYMMDRFAIGMPPGLAYGVEPAVYQLERNLLELPETPLILTPGVQTQDTSSPPR